MSQMEKKKNKKPHQKHPQNCSSQSQKIYSLKVSEKLKIARRTRQLQQHPSEPFKGLKKIPSWPSALLSSVSHDRKER